MTKKTKKQKKYSKFIVAIIIGLNIIFTACALIISNNGNNIPDSLVISWFGWTGGELLALAGIKIKEKKDVEE